MNFSGRQLDMLNMLLGAILGAVMGSSDIFKPADGSHILQSMLFIALIVAFAINCQWTVRSIAMNRTGYAIFFVSIFIVLELVLISFGIQISVITGGNLNIALTFNGGTNIWIIVGTFGALYALNVVITIFDSAANEEI